MELAAGRCTAGLSPCSTCAHRVCASRAAWALPREALTRQHPRRRAAGRAQRWQAAGSSGNGSSPHAVDTIEQRQQQPQLPSQEALKQAEEQGLVWTKFVAETLLPTRQGKFRLRGYRHTVDGGRTFTEPSVIISGKPEGQADVAVRVHDACFTSEVLGSLKCDCREQLELSLDYIQANQPGMVVYLQQEGRGIGLANKIAAYALQEKGLDTVDANRALGLPDDCREYSAVRHILAELAIPSIRLMTNNPRKLKELANLGIPVTGRIPCQVQAQKYNAGYLAAKTARMDHLLVPEMNRSLTPEASLAGGEGDEEALEGQFCFWDHEGEPSSAGIIMEGPVPLPEGLDVVSSQIVCNDVPPAAAAISASSGSSSGSGGAGGDGKGSGGGSGSGPPAAAA